MKYILLFILSLYGYQASAQSYSFSQYEVEDGLIQSSVNCFLQDQYGNLWVGTSGGLSNFDGQEFINYGVQDGLPGNHVYDIFQYGDSLLIATHEGLSVFDGSAFHNFAIKDSLGQPLPVQIIFRDQEGQVNLIMAAQILGVFDGKTIHLRGKLTEEHISSVAADASGLPWITTYQGNLYTFQKDTLVDTGAGHDVPYYFSDLIFDDQQQLWLAAMHHVLRYDPSTNQLETFPLVLPEFGRTFKLTQDSEGMIWVGTSDGTFCFDPEKQKIDHKSRAFDGSVINNIYKDHEGNLWFGSFGDGFYKFKGRLFTKLRQEEGLKGKTFMAVMKDSQGSYWFGSYGGGVDQLSGHEVINFDTEKGLSNNFISTLAEDSSGAIWIGTHHGLNRYDGHQFTTYDMQDGLPYNGIFSSFRAPDQTMWFGTKAGPVYWQNNTFHPIQDEQGKAFDKPIMLMQTWKEDAYLFASEKEVYLIKDQHASLFLSAEQLNQGHIIAMAQDTKGHLWLAAVSGELYHYHPETRAIRHLNRIYDIPNSLIYSMIFADDGSLLLGTQRGINRLFFYEDGSLQKVQHYGKNEGFLGVETNANAILKDDDGSIWFGTVNGMYRYNLHEEHHDFDQIMPHLTGVKLSYQDTNWKRFTDSVSHWYQIPHHLTLPYQHNHLMFTFKAVSLSKPDQVMYSFILEGYEDEWSPATGRSEAVYPNLPPGAYTFKVKARSPNGVWSEEPIAYAFVISPPYWHTWWFYMISFLLLIMLIRLYIYWNLRREREQRLQLEFEVKGRTREIQALNNSLEKRVKDRTAELELSNKKFEVEFELRKLDQEKLAQREREYRQLVNNLREIIFKTNIRGELTFLNDRWQEYMGYGAGESIGRHFTQYLFEPENERARYLQVFDSIIARELPHFEAELRMIRKDGNSFWAKVSVRIEYNEEGEIIGTNGSLVDIDQRKKAEFALRASEDRYKFLIENTQDVITLQSLNLIYFYASPRIFEVAGLEPEDIIGKSSLNYLHPDDSEAYLQLKEEVTQLKTSKGRVVRFKDGSGEFRWYETFLKPIFDENGELRNFISSSRDVTDKVELSKEIEKVRKKVAQDFHDEMGNNLASISVLSQIIQNKLGHQSNGVEALLNKIDVAAKNLFSGTRDFIWAIDPKNDNLKEVYFNLKDFAEELFDNTGINFYASFDQEDEDIRLKLPSGWSRQLVLIFKEAFTNALKYANASCVSMCFHVDNESFYIQVKDNGKGFSLDKESGFRGINNMRDRAAKIKAQFDIHSDAIEGSRVVLKRKITHFGLVKTEAK
ncbi:two-component regulator propeller domain-containing protein [Catalinimonas niigatensis]|uniref:two-component regulator propeller domain-containing protein n=1 Tax=Catalinimonas niigatensis TaxID=1397264 RepID=UPI0026658C68|nr:two-component regulator propeller domain-containing protein [Catalinimonas niigatensis]WPP52257.1 PAS domain S-box protein [Catalinimonas niigatensis]